MVNTWLSLAWSCGRGGAYKVDEIYQLLSRAMDLPPATSWLDDEWSRFAELRAYESGISA
jgi:hypothetical protein